MSEELILRLLYRRVREPEARRGARMLATEAAVCA